MAVMVTCTTVAFGNGLQIGEPSSTKCYSIEDADGFHSNISALPLTEMLSKLDWSTQILMYL